MSGGAAGAVLKARRISLISIVLAGSTAAILLITAVAWLLGSELVEPQNHPVPLPAGFDAQIVSIPGSGHAIAGWWVDQGEDSPVVLVLHGVRSDRSSMVSRAQLLVRHGFSVLLIDLQAEGETSGEEPSGFDAVVLEAVYPRIGRAIENRIRIWLGPLAPVLTPLLLVQLQPRLHIAQSDLEPIRSIERLGAPVLVAAGSRDEHTTLAESQELFGAAAAPKQMWIVEGAKHQDLLKYDPKGYEEHVVIFLKENLISKSPAVVEKKI